MELWGGFECTVNRVGDRYRDQLRLTGHHDRLDDLARAAALGITALRFPVLWERVAPDDRDPDWAWSDRGLRLLGEQGIRPIIGLLHHGSGPAHTSLVADDFPAKFTAYAAAVAARYPRVRDWTPINEPLTTARFSTLYGTWYPHARDRAAFWRAILNQAEATGGAMRAIRAVRPDARLIQTDDLGTSYAAAELEGVAGYYNERRWLFWDILIGRVGPGHFFWAEAEELGFADRLRALADAPCPPDLLGINHYPTSDRYLRAGDEPGGFADEEALRVMPAPPGGLAAALWAAWERYRLPIAITEVHLGSTREEQLRWLRRSWDGAHAVRERGADVRAVTAWALAGNVDWTSLITTDRGDHEPGAYDIRGPTPRATAVARLLTTLERPEAEPLLHAIAAQPGWWEREVRLPTAPGAWGTPDGGTRPILITGATGTLGQALAGACRLRGLTHVLTDRATLPIDDAAAIGRVLDAMRPWAVVNAAGWVRVEDAEDEAEACHRDNARGATLLTTACAQRGIHCTLFSSDLVFGDDTDAPRDEDAATAPLNVYGRSKAAMERLTRDAAPLVIRTAAFFSPFDPHNFAMHVERALGAGDTVLASAAHVVTPTHVPDLVRATLDLIVDGETGLWHLTNEEPMSWLQFGRRVAGALYLDASRVVHAEPDALGWRARRPRSVPLTSARGRLLPSFTQALASFAATRRAC